MANRVRDLMRILPPPANPVGVPSPHRINSIETRINLTLPDDFKEILVAYGSGTWQAFYFLANPYYDDWIEEWTSPEDDDTGQTELAQMRYCRGLDKIYTNKPKDVPYAIFPEDGGILPWAQTENGGCVFWITKGGRSKWRSVYYIDNRRTLREELDLSCSEILYASVSGELPVFNGELPNLRNSRPEAVFEPAEDDE